MTGAIMFAALAVMASVLATEGMPFLSSSFEDTSQLESRSNRLSRQNGRPQFAQLPPSLGDQGFGNQSPGNQGFGTQRPGNQGFGNQRPGNQGFGNQRPGNQGFGSQGFGDGSDDDDLFVFDRPTPSRPRPIPSMMTRPTAPVTMPTVSPATGAATTADSCTSNCLTTGEFNPVCGTDRVTYTNPGKLNCAVGCGRSVSLSHYGSCITTTTSRTTTRRPRDGEDGTRARS